VIHFELQQISCFLHRVAQDILRLKPPNVFYSRSLWARVDLHLAFRTPSFFSSPLFPLSRQYTHKVSISDTNRAASSRSLQGTPPSVPPVYPSPPKKHDCILDRWQLQRMLPSFFNQLLRTGPHVTDSSLHWNRLNDGHT
jgi:hypothetical protein